MHIQSLKIHILHLNISVFQYHLFFVFGVIFFFVSLKNKLKCLTFSKTHILVIIAFPKSLFSFLLLFFPLSSFSMHGRYKWIKNDGQFYMSFSEWKKRHFYFLNPYLGSVYKHCDNAISLCHSEFRITLCNFIYLSKAQDTAFFFLKENILILYLCTIELTKIWINKKCPIYDQVL